MRITKNMTDLEKLNCFLSRTVEVGSCKEWTGCCNTEGYPKICWKGNANGKGHRIVYELSHPGEDISKKVIRHTCDNPRCINPDHLLSGTPAQNMDDRDRRFRHGAAKLTAEQVVEIRNLFTNGTKLKLKAIGELYGVDQRTVSSIKCGSHWKHLLL